MSSSLNIGTTGLAASQKQLDVIGNNLANASTVGFKAADCYFASMLSQSLSGGGGSASVGQGVSVASVATVFSQGTFETTGNVTDVAIDGNGFFIVRDRENNALYTRAGAFHVENNGLLSDINKYSVQGRMYDSDGVFETQTLSALNLQDAQSKPAPTTYFGISATLDSQSTYGTTFDASQVVYDSRGAKHNLNTTFTKMEDAEYWAVKNSMSDTVDAKEVTVPAYASDYAGLKFNDQGNIVGVYTSTVITPTFSGAGTATYKINNDGNLYKGAVADSIVVKRTDVATWTVTSADYLNAKATVALDGTLGIDLDGVDSLGVPDIVFTLGGTWSDGNTLKLGIAVKEDALVNSKVSFYDINDPTAGLHDGATVGKDGTINWNLTGLPEIEAPKIKTFATTSRISALTNDGYAPGLLTGLSVGKDGIVEGMFNNGQRQKLARIILADFTNLQGLNKVGSYFIETAESGPHVNNKPGSGGLGSLQSNSLEMSNTDTAKEFIKMITAQRAYQSSAKIIAAADQMLQVLMNVKQ
jgi:flagellar hook protein FlgE